jgi:serine/threonine-protein kinase
VGVSIGPGDVIDGTYVIERRLGEGGMGAVFVAREDRLGRRVAVKVLLSEVADDPAARARFEREARSAAAVQSDHVTRVLSVGQLPGGAPYIVMELLEGEDLAGLLRTRGALPAPEVIDFVVQVCEALSEAHALGIVHGDL